MSEYQYYEFVTLERLLTAKEQDALRAVSSRAEITPTRFRNEYNFGDFRGDAAKLTARYFDAHLYFASWGTRRLMLRLPTDVVAAKSLNPYFAGDSARVSGTGQQVIVDLRSEEEGADYDEAEDGLLASLTPLRTELKCGDFRAAYLAWLLVVQAGEVDGEATEPPVPPGLSDLTAAQRAMVDFLRIDPVLVSAAAAESPALIDDSAAFRRWVRALAPRDKEQWLERAINDSELRLGPELLGAFRRQTKTPPSNPGRSAAALLTIADEMRERRARRPRRAAR
ncbi:MAG TPA: hypothetical protein VEQ58_01725 [Polyangiaceae bacterium]|nr:hypothetical protein [Polyangiaceae bacterium]